MLGNDIVYTHVKASGAFRSLWELRPIEDIKWCLDGLQSSPLYLVTYIVNPPELLETP